jgi:uncharacterized membrane protein
MYLFYPALGYVNLFEFHANIFIPFFLTFTFYFFMNNRFKAFLILSFLSLSCQENVSLIIFMFGFYALLNKKSLRWVITPFILGGLWFVFTLNFIMPLLNNGNVNFFTLYSHLGNSFTEIIKTIILKPIFVLKQFFMVNKGIFLLQLFVPVSFLAFFAPRILLLAIPIFLQHLLSLRPSETSIYYHYTAETIPIVFIASIYGLKYILKNAEFIKLRYRATSIFLIVIIIFSNLRIGPQLYLVKYLSAFRMKAIDREKERLLKIIPKDASVVATFEFLPRLSLRNNLHSFHFIYSGHYTLTSKKYEVPKDLTYALIDFDDPLTFNTYYSPRNSKNIREFLIPDNWGVVEAVDNIVLFKKQYQSKIKLYEILNSKDNFGSSATKINEINDKITLLRCDINKDMQVKERVSLIFYWECHEKMNEDYAIILKFLDKNNKFFYEKLIFPCYRIYPTYEWNKGEIIRDWHYIFIPEDFKDAIFNVEIILFDQRELMIRT